MDINELKIIRNEIINNFLNGLTVEELCNIYAAKWGYIYNMISPVLRKSLSSISEFERYQIRNMYLNGMSSTKIAVKLKIYHKTINKILDDFGIKRKYNGKRKYMINDSYFDNIDTQNKAYILGLLYADGYNSLDKSTIRLQLQESDYDILEKIRKELNSQKPLKYIICDNKVANNGYTSKNMYQLEFYSSHMCRVLDDLGMHQNKSLILKFPNWLNSDLYSHFLRGYFDGDGSYCHRYTQKYGNRDLVTFTSTYDFCVSAQEIINKYSYAKGGGIYDASCHNGTTKVLAFSGKNQVKSLLDWLYQNAELYLNRKFDIYYNRFIA